MEQRNLGRSGLRVSKVGLGCNNFGGKVDIAVAKRIIDVALDVGINFLDTADVYGGFGGSEAAIGEALGSRRQHVVIGTKFAYPMDKEGKKKGGSRSYIITALEDSLRRLKTDWIDLYQMHFPDPLTPIEETLRALDDAVTQGKVRYIGFSNFASWQIADADWISRSSHQTAFVSAQDEYSLLFRDVEKEILPAVRRFGLGFLPYYPLASGLLTGKYQAGTPPPPGSRFATTMLGRKHAQYSGFEKIERLKRFASERHHCLLELAFSWLACQPSVSSVIAGATSPEQLLQNAVAADWILNEHELADIDRLLSDG
jgi:aryl-alcohol dehydrogenase-like predicted oxidoreductase